MDTPGPGGVSGIPCHMLIHGLEKVTFEAVVLVKG
jgi:hypothetical protein